MKRHTITDDERDEFRVRKPRLIRCADRMCGADDCPNCHPENTMSDKKKPVFVLDERSYETGPSALPTLPTVKINLGPHVSITERSEKLVCTRCDFLKHNLIRSGRDPQWECLCLHPRAKEVNEAMPHADRCWSTNGAPGCWIGEQPDTPEWCPLLKQNLDKPSASDRRANGAHKPSGDNQR